MKKPNKHAFKNIRRKKNALTNWLECKRNRFALRRARANYKEDLSEKPLISVIIPTYNKGKILTERAIPSVLTQTYQNFELIIVGDHCTDNTEQLVKDIDDRRIVFINLPKRGKYPKNPRDKWLVAGSIPRNKGLELASGEWVAPLDDDDEFSENHLEVLLNYAIQNRYEMVYGVVKMEDPPGKWVNCGSYPPLEGGISHIAVLYHSKLKFLKYNSKAWKLGEPDDWNLWRRMEEAGVKIGLVNRIVGTHYREFTRMNEEATSDSKTKNHY
jgi:glycosyltransferase involved in cell wall biosynthesis